MQTGTKQNTPAREFCGGISQARDWTPEELKFFLKIWGEKNPTAFCFLSEWVQDKVFALKETPKYRWIFYRQKQLIECKGLPPLPALSKAHEDYSKMKKKGLVELCIKK